MNRNIFYFFAVILFAVLTFTGCQKDGLIDASTNETLVTEGFVSEPAVIDGETMVFNLKKNSSKGYFQDETGWIEQQTIKDFPYGSTANNYRVIKVVRPNGRYFWIMIDNFKYSAGSGCWIYGDNSANLATFGRLYNWTTANNSKTKIMMQLPKIVNGVPSTTLYTTYGRLPNFQDIKDLLETTAIGNLPGNGTTIYDGTELYYEAFVAGRDYTENYTNCPTLAGWRNNGSNPYYRDIKVYGRFWTSEYSTTAGSGFHYPLSISSSSDMWSAYVNAAHINAYGFSVRYVFEPVYQ